MDLLTKNEAIELLPFLTGPERAELDSLLSISDIPPLRAFVSEAWPVLEPATRFVPSFHIDAVCEHLEAVSDGQIKRLIINIPPGSMKSLLVSVMWPVWDWLKYPHRRFLTASYAQSLATRDSLKSRRLIQSRWFQSQWGNTFRLTGDQNQKTRYENSKTGFRVTTSVGGGTGERANVKILDDPHSIDEVESDTIREGVIDWVRTVWSERSADRQSADIVVMQRLHERDVSGYLLNEIGGYEHLMLPMSFEPGRRCHTVIGFSDPRMVAGELLCPERYDQDAVRDKEKRLGPYGTAGQLQQNPSPTGGGIFKNVWWRFWKPKSWDLGPVLVKDEKGEFVGCPVVDLPELRESAQTWDCSFKSNADSSFVSGQVWGFAGSNSYLLDEVHNHLDIVGTIEEIRRLTLEYPAALAKFIEDKANGPAVIQLLTNEIPGLIPVTPMGDKLARAQAVVPLFWAGNVHLPHPELPGMEWVWNYMAEFTSFPKGKNDRVDAASQLLALLLLPVQEQRVIYNPVKIGSY